ncbi:peptide/nickel transport system ATP-binding protein [Thermanaeromonas toyohensis ToBE]|uniref:Peptide/nickel transport system ATP-binding protein n=1 Tax=Thermanaeromonas toyohensis ToBE TaxID=698762 RepID=A0A1W1W2C7_9FIRM|nr:ABC transporter ATP-binding protein [Thermanaeromonas toyohensis]SMB99653.1 peptide/nickel transport system ATP-binding protein [Thermanaeromonas toyohensis ToBE]
MLVIKDLQVSFGHLTVLKGINLRLEKGEVLAVVGESGAGKTTLGLSIMGLSPGRCTGQILFKGRDILALPEEERCRIRGKEIAMVFQNVEDALHPLYPVVDQVMEAILIHGLKDKEVAQGKAVEILKAVGLRQDRLHTFPHQLSGGEKQRVLLALALANDPEVLILDEPTASLDVITRAEIISLLKRVIRDKIVLLITHDLSTAAKLATRVAVLYGGRVVELGATRSLFTFPRHPYTRGFLRSYPNMTTVKDLQGIPGPPYKPVGGCPFHPRCTQRMEICSQEVPELKGLGDYFLACHRGGIIPLLEIKNLSKSFNGVRAVQEVELTLYEGETLALVGESGSGKTTLALTIMGLLPPDKGEIWLEGQKVLHRDKEFYQRVQMIFQNPQESLSHRMNVLQLVKEPLDVQGWGREEEKVERVKQVLEEVELPTQDFFLHKYPHELSGGEAQRVAIARALVLNPKLLIADEPTSALDASIQAKILKLLLNLQEKRGLAILFITHDIALARKVSDRLAVMKDGSLVEEGPASEVISNPKHPYTRTLLSLAADLTEGISVQDMI